MKTYRCDKCLHKRVSKGKSTYGLFFCKFNKLEKFTSGRKACSLYEEKVKKSRKKPETPRSRVKSALRQVWLRSRERATALKRESYTCQKCHRKQSMAKGREFKVEVHHKKGILNWDKIMTLVYEHLLCNPDNLEVLCKECHEKEHK